MIGSEKTKERKMRGSGASFISLGRGKSAPTRAVWERGKSVVDAAKRTSGTGIEKTRTMKSTEDRTIVIFKTHQPSREEDPKEKTEVQ